MSERLAICAIIKNELSYLPEWIAYHRLMGVSLFRFYDTGSDDGSIEFLRSLGRLMPIELIHWSPPGAKQSWQTAAYTDAAKELSGRVEFVAFIDPDEFLATADGDPIPDVLARFHGIKALASSQRVFGSGGQTKRTDGLVIERFTSRGPIDYDEGCWFKTIARPEEIERWTSCHSANLKNGASVVMADGLPLQTPHDHPGKADRVALGPIWHNHFMLKSLEEFQVKQARGALDDNGEYKRFTDDYFWGRNQMANQDEDRSMLRFASETGRYARMIENHNRPWNRVRLGGLEKALRSYFEPPAGSQPLRVPMRKPR